ncbi:MAG TPA: rRNA pseudouridine synthase, partial [Alphaproteobacteria bacterium]|nr:rRNA pseudouridine synthase [Alphaproteobacteria bacterium]
MASPERWRFLCAYARGPRPVNAVRLRTTPERRSVAGIARRNRAYGDEGRSGADDRPSRRHRGRDEAIRSRPPRTFPDCLVGRASSQRRTGRRHAGGRTCGRGRVMTESPDKGERIAKRLARAGLCSRREAEAWIRAGRVAVDGKVLDSPAVTVTDASAIAVDGKPIPEAEPTRLWRYHKPPGLVTTTRDPQGRPTVFDRLPADMPRVMTVGRLDLSSEGLLLLTNDGELARRLEQPATGWLRRYRVRVRGQV